MKIQELHITESNEEVKKGTYVAARPTEESANMIAEFSKKHNVPNVLNSHELHTTIIYSRNFLPNLKIDDDYGDVSGTVKKYHVWTTNSDTADEQSKCLVAELACDAIVDRHTDIMDNHDATYDYDVFTPHITLSYNIGDFDISSLPLMEDPIYYAGEYIEELKLNWSDDHQ